MEQNFVHLRLHTEYSLRDGLLQISSLIEKAAACRMPAIAITDISNLYATVKFYQAAIAAGIKPIIGVDLWVADEKKPDIVTRLTLLCQTNQGYQHLLQLVSKSYLCGQHAGVPVIQKSWLQTLSQGLIALLGQDSDIGEALLTSNKDTAQIQLQYWQDLFPDRLYIEINRVGRPKEREYLIGALQLAQHFALPVVATNDVRFLERDDFEAHEARVCIHEGAHLNDPQRTRAYTEQQYLRTPQEMQKLFADIPNVLLNTVEIAKRCNVSLTLGVNRLPHFEVPLGDTTESFLSKIAQQGLEERLQIIFANQPDKLAEKRQAYDSRLIRELDVINKMGFAGYFLIVADFTKWSKENGIPVGPGRGSGPGSLVAYALKITDLDPLAFELLFERFLNPERVSMPDFDIDFCIAGRDRVIDYVMQRHGHESVSQIITYGTMAAKAVVRDVGRVLGLGYNFVDKIAKLIPFELGMTLDRAMEQEPLLRERYETEEEVRTLMDLALKLEGLTRNVGKHAGGIVIAPGKLTDFVPLYCEPNEAAHPVTQFDKDDVEAVGLVKFDFLGLKTLTIIDRALQIANANRSREHLPPIDISLIPLDDAKTYALLKACQSTAVFQLESFGMRDLIKRLHPDCFEDLIALVALYRPGPLQSGMVDDFINRKHGRAKVIYPHPELEPILRPTYGVILYQEQVMQIAQVLAGYTLGSADILRRAMGKKKPEEMAKQRQIFCDGAVARGVAHDVATFIFDLMEKFAGYGFNKSHSASYALIAYQTAWLKAHYPAAFMSAVLSTDMDRTEKIIVLLNECEVLKLHVSPPDINRSKYYFETIDDKNIMYGLGAIKGVGEAVIENIIAARNAQGPFKNLFDFCERIDLKKINKRVFEALIKSGCFDSLGQHRASLFASLNHALQCAEQKLHNQTYGQFDLLSVAMPATVPEYIEAPMWDAAIQLQGEKETLGFYLTGHPLNQYLSELVNFTSSRIAELTPGQQQTVRVAGIIANIRIKQTKRGDRIGIFTLDDGTSQIEAVCFAEAFQKYRSLLVEDQIVIIDGEIAVDEFNNGMRMVARDLCTIDEARTKYAKMLRINVLSDEYLDINHLKSLLTNYVGGTCPVLLRYIRDNIKADIRFGQAWFVNPCEQLITTLSQFAAIKDVQVEY